MAETDEDPEEFDPTRMESVMIAPPLEEQMNKLAYQQEHLDEIPKDKRLPDPLPVVIDLNYKFPGGLPAARDSLCDLLTSWNVEKGGTSGERIMMRKTRLSSQYVFARLSNDTIRRLAEKMSAAPDDTDDAPVEDAPRIPVKQREIFMIWPDFQVRGHVHRTVSTIKADAVRNSFRAEGDGIIWAVLDSGIDGDHAHFVRHRNLDLPRSDTLLRHMDFTQDRPDVGDLKGEKRDKAMADEATAALTDDYGHGTHVAGIIAGEYVTDPENGYKGRGPLPTRNASFSTEAFIYVKSREQQAHDGYAERRVPHLSGMSPRTKLVSFKVLDENGRGEASNIIAALTQIQIINNYGRDLRIHGVNLSVGYPFDPEWFACGHSPLCTEVNRLVKTGVVVVVSAGNSGYGTKQTLMTRNLRAGMLMTINDPGNAEDAITVGSTHRDKAHQYGPSFFSSKGPTGDGRFKPDMLAPGERIISCAAGRQLPELSGKSHSKRRAYVEQTGTSMAAPHVSGAIAAFLSIRQEFIGRPEKIKEIFVGSATDLGRDRYMQGAGMVDLMRAIQSV